MKDSKLKEKYRLQATNVLKIYVLILKEPDNTILRPINHRRSIVSISDSDCKTFFGFSNQQDLLRLLKCLRLDKSRIVLSNGSVMSGEEIFLRGLYELITGEFQSSVAINVFGRDLSQQSRAFSYFIDYIYHNFCYLLLDNLSWFKESGLLEKSRLAIRKKLEDLGYVFEINEKHTIGLFIDCNCLKTFRPVGGPLFAGHDARRYSTLVQQAFCNVGTVCMD